MTKNEAILALLEDYKLSHRFFTIGEYISLDDYGNIVFEDGLKVNEKEFWSIRKNNDWEIGWEIYNGN